MTDLTPDKLTELRALNEARTQGEWTPEAWLAILRAMLREDAERDNGAAAMLVGFPDNAPQFKADAAFIAAAANAMPALLALAERAQRMREALDKAEKRLICSQGRGATDLDVTCYCPNCDRSLRDVRYAIRAAMEEKP